jgi:hypothetical protein
MVVACMLHNMILMHDGLDTLWEDGVNWRRLNPRGAERHDGPPAADEEDEPEEPQAPVQYLPEDHNDDEDFVPVFIEELNREEGDELLAGEAFKKLRNMLANHLHYAHEAGELYYPLTRTEINNIHNILPRQNFPNANEIINFFFFN